MAVSRRLLVLTRYTRLGASSRLRTFQYAPWLEAAGFAVEYSPFFDDDYLRSLYEGGRKRSQALRCFRGRFHGLRGNAKPDVVWLEKEALPWLPWPLEVLLWPDVPVVSDHDDAVFHRYDQHASGLVRWLLGQKVDQVMNASALVTAGNAYLAERAVAAGARAVEVVPTVVDLNRYAKRPPVSRNLPAVGWIGTPQTWADLGKPIHSVLLPVLRARAVHLRAIGAALTPSAGEHLQVVPWSEAAEADLIRSFDIGVMPLPDTPWTRGKCGYKLIQYMACGLPVIASPVGVNTSIVEHGVNGFLASTEEQWRDALWTLLSDPALRHRMGQAGRRKVEAEYSLQVWGPRVAGLLMQVVENGLS